MVSEVVWELTWDFSITQPRPPQVDRPRPDHHQRQATTPAPPVLQEQEVHAPRPPPQADSCHPPPPFRRGRLQEAGEDEEARPALPPTQIRYQGGSILKIKPSEDEKWRLFFGGALSLPGSVGMRHANSGFIYRLPRKVGIRRRQLGTLVIEAGKGKKATGRWRGFSRIRRRFHAFSHGITGQICFPLRVFGVMRIYDNEPGHLVSKIAPQESSS